MKGDSVHPPHGVFHADAFRLPLGRLSRELFSLTRFLPSKRRQSVQDVFRYCSTYWNSLAESVGFRQHSIR